MRLVLDEHFDPAVAEQLRGRGHDVIAVKDDEDLIGLSDRALLAWAIEAGRVIVTYNARDFGPLAQELQAVGEPFPGVIMVSPRRYPQGRSFGALMRDLAALCDDLAGRDALSGRSVWLRPEQKPG